MSDKIPEWITNLALDVYSLIQKHDAMPHFQEMVREVNPPSSVFGLHGINLTKTIDGTPHLDKLSIPVNVGPLDTGQLTGPHARMKCTEKQGVVLPLILQGFLKKEKGLLFS